MSTITSTHYLNGFCVRKTPKKGYFYILLYKNSFKIITQKVKLGDGRLK